jgi:hypothetical protein
MNHDRLLEIIVIILIVALLCLYVLPPMASWVMKICNKSEYFSDTSNRVNNTEPVDYKQDSLDIIQPPMYNSYDDTIQSGSLFIPQPEYYNTQGEKVVLGNTDNTDITQLKDIGDNGLNFDLCSPSCCADQWPVPFKMPVDKMTCGSKDEYVPSSYFCNNGWQDSGCLCLKKDQADFINSRGLNTDL